MPAQNPSLYIADDGCGDYGAELAAQFNLTVVQQPPACPYLSLSNNLVLVQPNTKVKPLDVDFLAGKNRHRQLYGGGKNQLLCKAVGLNKGVRPSVLDMTAGFGQDAFVLAGFGCELTLVERSPFAAALLFDGLRRLDADANDAVSMTFIFGDGQSVLLADSYDVVYLDPMYPETGQKAAVKKSMAAFRSLVGKDDDADNLFARAMGLAKHRVVVKRPLKGRLIAEQEPTYSLKGKTSRYDIYALKAFEA